MTLEPFVPKRFPNSTVFCVVFRLKFLLFGISDCFFCIISFKMNLLFSTVPCVLLNRQWFAYVRMTLRDKHVTNLKIKAYQLYVNERKSLPTCLVHLFVLISSFSGQFSKSYVAKFFIKILLSTRSKQIKKDSCKVQNFGTVTISADKLTASKWFFRRNATRTLWQSV